jgi:hypothetical protein
VVDIRRRHVARQPLQKDLVVGGHAAKHYARGPRTGRAARACGFTEARLG